VAAAALVAPATAGVTSVAVRPLPPDRLGTVVAWQAKSKTAVVALSSGRLMTIHALRKRSIGTRVRVTGIKWGTPTAGIKWARATSGIKWGIKWARNGTYQSHLNPISRVTRVRIRGVVVKRYAGAVAIGAPGGVVVVRQASWLPRAGKKTTVPQAKRPVVGQLVTTNARIVGPHGRLYGDGVRIIPTAGRLPVPIGGSLKRSATRTTVRITSANDPAYTVTTTMQIPAGVDASAMRPGTEVAATATVSADGSLRVAQLAPNTSFAAANNPNLQIVVPTPASDTTLALIDEAVTRWNRARAENRITDATVAADGLAFLRQAKLAGAVGDWVSAAMALDLFLGVVESNDGTIDAEVAAGQVSFVSAILLRLTG